MRLIVIALRRIELGFEVAAVAVLFANAIPAGFDLHAVGDITGFAPSRPLSVNSDTSVLPVQWISFQ